MLPKSGVGGELQVEELFFASSQETRGGKHKFWKSILCSWLGS